MSEKIQMIIGLFLFLELVATSICALVRQWILFEHYDDYSKKMHLKYRHRAVPFVDLKPAEGKEAVVEKRNKNVHKMRNIMRLINVFIALLTWLIKR